MRRSWLGIALALPLALSAGAGEALRIDAGTLAALPEGARVDPGVTAGEDGVTFAQGGISLPTGRYVTAGRGLVDMTCRVPPEWPASGDRTLFHAQSKAHVHATLFFRDGTLRAVYKGSEARFAQIEFRGARAWRPGERHRIQFSWRQQDEEDVEFQLVVDGQPVGSCYGLMMSPWPERCEVGSRNGQASWQGTLSGITLSDMALPITVPESGERTVTVQAGRDIGACYPFWTVANCNGPHRFLQPRHAEGINRGQPFIRQINAVYLLGGRYTDQNVWYRGLTPEGELDVDFTGMIAQLQAMIDGGFAPWIVLDNTPYAMSNPVQENTYGNTAPPDDEKVWARYVEAALRAMVAAFGRETVAGWWFRVGTEPDLVPGHWSGTREQYFAHYDHTVEAFVRVLPEAKIGPGNILNPAGGEFGTATRGGWGLDIIDHVACGTNAVTGRVGTRMDWFSFSWYGRVGASVGEFDKAVGAIRQRIGAYPRLGEVPLVVGEFAVLHDERGIRLWAGDTTEWSASFYAALADRVYRYGILHVYEWSQTTRGVLHPRAQVIGFLNRMSGGQRVDVRVEATSAVDCGAIACRKGEELYVLLYNHWDRRSPKIPETVHLVVRDERMKAGAEWTLTTQRIDAGSGVWAYAFERDCKEAGVPLTDEGGRYEGTLKQYGAGGAALFSKKIDTYRRLAELEEAREPFRPEEGCFRRTLTLPGHSVLLLKLSPE